MYIYLALFGRKFITDLKAESINSNNQLMIRPHEGSFMIWQNWRLKEAQD